MCERSCTLSAIMVMMAINPRIIGRLTAPWWMALGGGLTVLVMALAATGFFVL